MFDVPTLDVDLHARLHLVFGSLSSTIREIEERALRLLPEVTPVVWERDPATFQFLYVSRSAEQVTGHPAARWTAEFWPHFLVHPDDRLDAISVYALAVGRARDGHFTYRATRADGAVIVLRDLIKVIKGMHGIARTLLGLTVQIPSPSPDRDGDNSIPDRPQPPSRES